MKTLAGGSKQHVFNLVAQEAYEECKKSNTVGLNLKSLIDLFAQLREI